jgi:carbonic anhydrase
LRDKRTPKPAKWMLGFAVLYLAMPFDIVPDFIPVFGQLDDLIIVPALIFLSFKLIPDSVIEDCRLRARNPGNPNECSRNR